MPVQRHHDVVTGAAAVGNSHQSAPADKAIIATAIIAHTPGVHNTWPAGHVARKKPGPSGNVSILARNCLSYVTDDQAYLITAGFLYRHNYKCKNFAVVSVNRHQLKGDFILQTPGRYWGHNPQTVTAAPTSLPEIFLALCVK